MRTRSARGKRYRTMHVFCRAGWPITKGSAGCASKKQNDSTVSYIRLSTPRCNLLLMPTIAIATPCASRWIFGLVAQQLCFSASFMKVTFSYSVTRNITKCHFVRYERISAFSSLSGGDKRQQAKVVDASWCRKQDRWEKTGCRNSLRNCVAPRVFPYFKLRWQEK